MPPRSRARRASGPPLRPRRPRRPSTRSPRRRAVRGSTSSCSTRGRSSGEPAVEHGDELWDRVLEVNLTAQFVLARELGRRMVERGSGKIVFVASLLSFQGGVTVPGYAASKGGIAQLTKALANEWAPHGVNVNAVAPGYIATDNTQALRDDQTRARADPRAHPGRPLGSARGRRRRVRLPRLARVRLRPRRRAARRRRLARTMNDALDRLGAARVVPVLTVAGRGRGGAACRGAARRRPARRRDHVPHRCGCRGDPPRVARSTDFSSARARSSRAEQLDDAARGRRARSRSRPERARRWSTRCAASRRAVRPGVATPSEIERARALGCRVVKVFPASLLGGPAFVKAVARRLPGRAVRPDRRDRRRQPRRVSRACRRCSPAAAAGSASRRLLRERSLRRDRTARARGAVASSAWPRERSRAAARSAAAISSRSAR